MLCGVGMLLANLTLGVSLANLHQAGDVGSANCISPLSAGFLHGSCQPLEEGDTPDLKGKGKAKEKGFL